MLPWELRNHPHFWPYAALVSVCFFWGTTYLAIRIALESLPPMALITGRFLISGIALLAAARYRGVIIPRGRELWTTAANGLLLLGVSNICLTYSETLIPSGLAALFITTAPFWLIGVEAMWPRGEKPTVMTMVGLLVGLCGVGLLLAPSGLGGAPLGANTIRGFLLLQGASFCWNFGSIVQRKLPSTAHPIVSGAIQQLAVGLVTLPVALLTIHEPIHWDAKSLGAMLYLVVFGSMVGYSSYIYVLDHLPIALVSIYTYMNPVVAMILGRMFFNEPLGLREYAALAVIFAGVGIVKWYSPRKPADALS